MLRPVLVTPPATTPVSLVEAKAHCRVEGADSDAVLTAMIAAAVEHLDGWAGILGRALVTQTWRQDFRIFGSRMRLPVGPVASLSGVKHFDASNIEQTIDPSVYVMATDATGSYVELAAGKSWPATYDRSDAVRVTYVAGSDAADVPASIKAAILLLVGAWFENREETAIGVSVAPLPRSVGVNALLAPYRRVGV